jgi:diketogulonate reductase-like aldo/keto reductase
MKKNRTDARGSFRRGQATAGPAVQSPATGLLHNVPAMHRRDFIGSLAFLGAGAVWPGLTPARGPGDAHMRTIPSSGEKLPVVGLGSWLTFDVLNIGDRRERCRQVIEAFFERGGRLIDSSPMYGSSQEVIGESLAAIDNDEHLFAATKVWIPGRITGQFQMRNAADLWGVRRFDLLQIHNLVDWDTHLVWLSAWKAEGRVRYTGVTTSHGRRHAELMQIMRSQALDFVQFTYNIQDREAERALLPLARETGRAVIINRPFQGGRLFRLVEGRPLPDWAGEIDCTNWAQFFLKFIVSHPGVTCAIPATSRVDHLHENMGALEGRLPEADMRREMVRYFESVTQ